MTEVTATEAEPQKCKQIVFESDRKCVFRIPALLYERESESVVAFAEQRESAADSRAKKLVMKTGKLKEESPHVKTIQWSDFKSVDEARIEGHRTMNPCPLYERNNQTLFLFFICVEGTVEESWQINNGINKTRLCYIYSEDLGQSWSSVTDLTDTLAEINNWATFAVGPGHGIQMESGRLIVPVYGYAKGGAPYALSLYSDDNGDHWQFGKMLQTKSIECGMAEFFDEGQNSFIYCNARSQEGYRVEAISVIKGHEFCKLSGPPTLPETGRGCQGSVISFPAQSEDANTECGQSQDKNKWLLYTHPSNHRRRIDLGVYLNKSPQDPNTWSKPWIINQGPSGYSDLAYIGEGWFACLMECGDKTEIEQIACVVFNYNSIKRGIEE
ncbi:sialidase-4-like [Echeneis naucrates]|uniref:exo-alpha-sialidase n=1 Tax=Echeneis naucrates TaxID=173247 RepID=A0A665X8S3_ECHNA|nr:sialidase-4-like [Echeneis naucrates]